MKVKSFESCEFSPYADRIRLRDFRYSTLLFCTGKFLSDTGRGGSLFRISKMSRVTRQYCGVFGVEISSTGILPRKKIGGLKPLRTKTL